MNAYTTSDVEEGFLNRIFGAVLALAVLVIVSGIVLWGCGRGSERNDMSRKEGSLSKSRERPQMDMAAPGSVETATFALG
jgi:hypothetical protein